MTTKPELQETYDELMSLENQWNLNNKTSKTSKYSVSHKLLGYFLIWSGAKLQFKKKGNIK